jgi:hypothetical protein
MTAKPSGQKPVAARSGRFCRRQKTFDVYRDRQGRICRRLFRPRGGGRSQGGCRGAPDRRQRHARGDAGNRRRIPPRTWRRCAVLGQVNSRIGKKSSSMARRGAPRKPARKFNASRKIAQAVFVSRSFPRAHQSDVRQQVYVAGLRQSLLSNPFT